MLIPPFRYLYRKSYPASAIAPYNAAKVNLGLVRKALRVGKNVEHFKAAAIALQSPLAKVPLPKSHFPLKPQTTVGRGVE
jgi:hypothetical protein